MRLLRSASDGPLLRSIAVSITTSAIFARSWEGLSAIRNAFAVFVELAISIRAGRRRNERFPDSLYQNLRLVLAYPDRRRTPRSSYHCLYRKPTSRSALDAFDAGHV